MKNDDRPLRPRIKEYDHAEGMLTLPTNNAARAYCNILDAMQEIEGIGGIEGEDYIAVMTALSAEALKRARICRDDAYDHLLEDLGKDDVVEFLENNNVHLKAKVLSVSGNMLFVETEHGDRIGIINTAVTYRIERGAR